MGGRKTPLFDFAHDTEEIERLRVNPEQVLAFMPGCRRVDFLSSQAYKTPIMIPRDR